jgi:alpha-beta hydrolase superfamily lysophospholipase
MHYRRWPVEEPVAAVALLPGTGQHSVHYHRFAHGLGARRLETWCLDTAGQGLSEGDPAAPGSIDELTVDALRLLGLMAAELARTPLIVAGHSLGAATALAMLPGATDFRVRALVLTGTPGRAVAFPLIPAMLPVLALHGVDDRRAPIDAIRDWTIRQPSVRLHEYADAGHDLLHEPVHARVTTDIADWIHGVVDTVTGTPRRVRE